MYRLVRVRANVGVATPLAVVYNVAGGRCTSQFRRYLTPYNASVNSSGMSHPIFFNDAIVLEIPTSISEDRHYCFELDIPYPQSAKESVFERNNKPVIIEVFNENNVLICSYGLPTSSGTNNVPGEMTSEPIDGSGEMASESIAGTGETASESISGTGEMESESIGGTGEMT